MPRLFPTLFGGTAVILTASVYAGAFAPQQAGQSQGAAAASQRGVVNRYCITCHNERMKTGGLSLDGVDLANVGEHPEIWEKVIQKLHGNLMPPAGRPRPDEETYKNLITLPRDVARSRRGSEGRSRTH